MHVATPREKVHKNNVENEGWWKLETQTCGERRRGCQYATHIHAYICIVCIDLCVYRQLKRHVCPQICKAERVDARKMAVIGLVACANVTTQRTTRTKNLNTYMQLHIHMYVWVYINLLHDQKSICINVAAAVRSPAYKQKVHTHTLPQTHR